MESFQLACRLYWCSDIFILNTFMSLFLTRTVLHIQVQSVSISTGAHLNSHIGWVKLTNTLLLTHIVHRTVSIWINWNNYQVRRLWTFSRVSISTHQYMFSCQVAVWSHQNSCSWILPQCWYISAHNCLTCDYTHWHLKVHKDCKHMYQICWFSCICACSVVVVAAVVVVVVVVVVIVCVCVYVCTVCVHAYHLCACVHVCMHVWLQCTPLYSHAFITLAMCTIYWLKSHATITCEWSLSIDTLLLTVMCSICALIDI